MVELTVREAAAHLQVHQSRVRGLLRAGTLAGRRVGHLWVIDLDELDRHRDLVRGGGTSRAMSPRVAWAAGALVDGQPTPWLTSSERARLAARLRAHNGEVRPFQRWLGRRQLDVTRYRVADADVGPFLAEAGVVATGVSAAAAYRLGLGAVNEAEAYVTAAVAERLVDTYVLVASDRGNLTLRTVAGSWHVDTRVESTGLDVAPRLMVAVDLLDRRDTRTTAAGHRLLTTTLVEYVQTRDASKARRT